MTRSTFACASVAQPRPTFIAPDLFAGGLASWPFGGLAPQAYDLIMADPPWRFELYSDAGQEKSADAQYQTMTLDAIRALPVADLARENAILWLWATAPMLPVQIGVLEAWGFTFKTSGVWVKTTVHGKIGFGTGYVLRNAHELFLIGTRGNPQTSRSVRSVVMGLAREHSRKPDEAFDAAEELAGGWRPLRWGARPRLCELFSRESRPGWEAWGNETGKFDACFGN